ncbi:MAG: 50S ribosomal protein L25 [Chloroflexota bacterium]|nr:50S ribosomal protein L25 [Chloroflexota bacterium]
MEQITLFAQPREVTGKAVKRLRRQGLIPAVVYGGPVEGSLSLQVDERELGRVLGVAGASRIIDLQVDGASYPVLTREVQRHPTRLSILHVDFLAVRMDKLIQADIRVVLVGVSPVEENPEAVMAQVADRVTVEALPANLPTQLELDISGLSEVGQTLTAGDLPLPSDVRLVSDEDTLLVSVTTPMRAPVEPEEVEEVAEVELPEDVEEGELEEEEVEEETEG